MICCGDKIKNLTGLAKFSKKDVIEICKKLIIDIQISRVKLRRKHINEILKRKTDKWNRYKWVSFGLFKKPTMRDAIYAYLHDGFIPCAFCDKWYKEELEKTCKTLLTCEKSIGDSIYLNVDVARAIGI